ncbi:MAG: endopeptidase La [Candidatus Cloacimonadota bacterium]|nr:MAG: endopeptidase La [Candidatus Cloacimonadota bacterium]PIE78505.1 MAG: endopeptidase La [Candidatus Delongbacteria bacterium]
MDIFSELSRELDSFTIDEGVKYPVVPLSDTIPFPALILPISLESSQQKRVIEDAHNEDTNVILLGKHEKSDLDTTASSYYKVGVLGKVLQVVKLPNLGSKAIIQPIKRVRVVSFSVKDESLFAEVKKITIREINSKFLETSMRIIKSLFEEYLEISRSTVPDLMSMINDESSNLTVLDIISSNINTDRETKQRLLEMTKLKDYATELHAVLQREIEFHNLERKVEAEVSKKAMNDQKDYFIREKIKGIKSELNIDHSDLEEVNTVKKMISEGKLTKAAEEKSLAEIEKLQRLHSMSPEYGLIRDYLDLIINLPWKKESKVTIDISAAEKILDEDHFGLKKPKERIIEYLSVLKLVDKIKGPIVCLVGPPGVGKTSLGRSIARALGREYIRVALGGLHDEAEIRGHRRTYIGAMPGKIIQSIKKSKVNNPLFLLDEIDKISSNFRGDPASALLEVLDPEQNNTFLDNYLDIEYDLSNVLFITTANNKYKIPQPLLDRMELIEIDGYLDVEKFQIAKKYLISKQMKENGVTEENLSINDDSIYKIITDYTMESGVRDLDRKIAKICRKAARSSIEGEKTIVTTENLENFLGVPIYDDMVTTVGTKWGSVNGLAWTSVGGSVLKVETNIYPGKEGLKLTGKLGEVMKESAQAALSFIRSKSKNLDIADDFFSKNVVHIHFPEAATPKDGPSAGITIATSLISCLLNIEVPQDIGMTGEITIHGDVLPIGGLNAKLMAAKRSKIKKVIIPKRNIKDLKEISVDILNALKIVPVSHVSEVFKEVYGETLV